DRAVRIGKSGDQHLRAEGPDLLRRKIHDRQHLPADELFARVADGDLGRRFADADLRTEIDPQLVRGPARLGKTLDGRHRADASMEGFEIIPRDLALRIHRTDSFAHASFAHASRMPTPSRLRMSIAAETDMVRTCTRSAGTMCSVPTRARGTPGTKTTDRPS